MNPDFIQGANSKAICIVDSQNDELTHDECPYLGSCFLPIPSSLQALGLRSKGAAFFCFCTRLAPVFFLVWERYDFDLFTIGGGSGGVRGSRWAAMQYGAKARCLFRFSVSASQGETVGAQDAHTHIYIEGGSAWGLSFSDSWGLSFSDSWGLSFSDSWGLSFSIKTLKNTKNIRSRPVTS